jgi:hypothetical protein
MGYADRHVRDHCCVCLQRISTLWERLVARLGIGSYYS